MNFECQLGADPTSVLWRFMCSRAQFSACRGPLGSGKTIGTVQRILKQMCEQPPNARGERPTRWLVVRNTYGDLTQTTIKDFLAVFEGMGIMRYGGLEPPNFHARFRIEDGSVVDADVIFLALDRDDSIKKLKGYQITGVWFNELSEISKAIVDMADLRHGRFPSAVDGGAGCGWHGILGDTNSFDTSHWLYKLEQQPPPGWEFFRQPGGVLDTGEVDELGRKVWRANPHAENLANLPADYYVRGMAGKDDDWIKVMLANEYGFTVHGKPVHPRFLHSRHVSKRPLAYLERYPILIGVDFGRTPSAVFFQHLTHIGRYHFLAEMPTEDMSAAVFAPEAFRLIKRRWPKADSMGWGDPAGDAQGQATDDTPILICRAAGLQILPAASNRWSLRKAAMDGPLMRSCMDGGPAILIDPGCETLIKGLMGGYHYRQLQVGGPEPRYLDTPEKNHFSHTCEAAHYGLLGAGEIHEALRPANSERRQSFNYNEGYDPFAL